MLRSATGAFTRVFDGLWRCAADPGSIMYSASPWVPALRCIVKNAAPRPGHETHCFKLSQDDGDGLIVPLRSNITILQDVDGRHNGMCSGRRSRTRVPGMTSYAGRTG